MVSTQACSCNSARVRILSALAFLVVTTSTAAVCGGHFPDWLGDHPEWRRVAAVRSTRDYQRRLIFLPAAGSGADVVALLRTIDDTSVSVSLLLKSGGVVDVRIHADVGELRWDKLPPTEDHREGDRVKLVNTTPASWTVFAASAPTMHAIYSQIFELQAAVPPRCAAITLYPDGVLFVEAPRSSYLANRHSIAESHIHLRNGRRLRVARLSAIQLSDHRNLFRAAQAIVGLDKTEVESLGFEPSRTQATFTQRDEFFAGLDGPARKFLAIPPEHPNWNAWFSVPLGAVESAIPIPLTPDDYADLRSLATLSRSQAREAGWFRHPRFYCITHVVR